FGTPEQKQKWLPRLANGAISAFALTEPGVGSDPAKMETRAVPSPDGKGWILNGEKLWCTNGLKAEIIVVMAQTAPKIVNGKEKKQISAFILEMDTPGIEIAHRCQFMGLRGIGNVVLNFKDVFIPRENLLWEERRGLAPITSCRFEADADSRPRNRCARAARRAFPSNASCATCASIASSKARARFNISSSPVKPSILT